VALAGYAWYSYLTTNQNSAKATGYKGNRSEPLNSKLFFWLKQPQETGEYRGEANILNIKIKIKNKKNKK
jgi:hypothetical protein